MLLRRRERARDCVPVSSSLRRGSSQVKIAILHGVVEKELETAFSSLLSKKQTVLVDGRCPSSGEVSPLALRGGVEHGALANVVFPLLRRINKQRVDSAGLVPGGKGSQLVWANTGPLTSGEVKGAAVD